MLATCAKMFSRQPRIPADVMFGTPPSTTESVHEYAAQLRKQMEKAFNLARQHALSKQLRQKELYDKKVHGKPYKQGDFVWLNTPMGRRGLSKKLHHPWAGPYKVVKKLSDATYRIEQIKGRRHRKVVHFDRLKLCPKNIHLEDDSQEVQRTSSPEPTRASTSTETHLPVGHVINYILYLNICQYERLKFNFIQNASEISSCLPRSQKWSSNQDPLI